MSTLLAQHAIVLDASGAWLAVGLFFVLGAVFGSFLNVVVFRVPKGLSLLHPPSSCPNCKALIRWYDNVPILGWLWLGGRCRTCRAPISRRYPLVELLLGITSAVVGWSLALVPIVADGTTEYAIDFAPYVSHMFLVSTLWCAALIELDGHRPPLRLLTVAFLLSVLVSLAWPAARGVFSRQPDQGLPILDAMFAAFVLSAVSWPAWIGSIGKSDVMRALAYACEVASVAALMGSGLASIATAASMAACLLLVLALGPGAIRRGGWSAAMALAAMGAIAASRSTFFEIGLTDTRTSWAGGAVLAALLSALVRALSPRTTHIRQTH